MTLKNFIMKCKVNFARTLCFFLIISQDPVALQLGSRVEAIILEAKSPCESRMINDYKGVITSPNYPSPFPEDVQCEWRIRSPPSTVLKIDIPDLDLSEDEDCVQYPCCSDHRLSIFRDGSPTILCGNNTSRRAIMVYQPVTIIKYYSSKNNCEGRGFKLIYSMKLHTCKSNELPCLNGKCHPKSHFCNGLSVCGDGSDEAFCYHIAHTANYNSVRKEILGQEYSGIDYPGLAEHWKCKDGSVKCPLSPGHCFFPTTDICNGKFDCPRGEEEIGCNPLCPKQLVCANGDGCYYPVHRCNGMKNCRDNSDEMGCRTEACVAMEFTCLNGACISGSAVCDGYDDCGDYSDEQNCSKMSFMKIVVVGLFSCIVLFCILLGCLYHLYTSRWRARPDFGHLIESETPDDDGSFREPPPTYSVAINDPRFLATPEMTERLLENHHGMFYPSGRNARRSRRLIPQATLATTSSQRMPSTRGYTQLNDLNMEPKSDDNDKIYDGERQEFQVHLDVREIVRSVQNELRHARRNESPFSTPSLSPSRESVTSCTSLEDVEVYVEDPIEINTFYR